MTADMNDLTNSEIGRLLGLTGGEIVDILVRESVLT